MSDEYEDLLAGMAQGSRRRGVKRGRPKERIIVRHVTIDFTEEKNEFVKQYMAKHNLRYVWEVVYQALDLLAEKEL